jgi:hypothetical protein
MQYAVSTETGVLDHCVTSIRLLQRRRFSVPIWDTSYSEHWMTAALQQYAKRRSATIRGKG